MKVQVHGQKGQIAGHVGITESMVEFQTVVNLDFGFQADIARVQVAVAVPDSVIGDAAFKKGTVLIDKPSGVAQHRLVVRRRNQFSHKGPGLDEIFFGIFADYGNAAVLIHRPAGLGLSIEGRQYPHQVFDFLSPDLTGGQQPVHHPVLGHLPHQDGVFHHPPATVHRQPFILFGDPRHPQVEIMGQPPVELNLLPAEITPLGQGAEIQEIIADRLFDFVHQTAGQENVGDVRLQVGDVCGSVGIGFRTKQGLDNPVLIGIVAVRGGAVDHAD